MIDIWGVSAFGLYNYYICKNWHAYFVGCFHFFSSTCLRMKSLVIWEHFWGTFRMFCKVPEVFYILVCCVGVFWLLHFFCGILPCLIIPILLCLRQYLIVILIFASLTMNDVQHFFIYSLTIFWRHAIFHSLIGISSVSLLNYWCYLYILATIFTNRKIKSWDFIRLIRLPSVEVPQCSLEVFINLLPQRVF